MSIVHPTSIAFYLLQFIVALLTLVSLVKVFAWIKQGNGLTPAMFFLAGFVLLCLTALVKRALFGKSGIDIQMHDFYLIITPASILIFIASIFGVFAAIYYWFSKLFGKYMNKALGYVHFWITLVCTYLIFFSFHLTEITGMPRRYYTNAQFESFNNFGLLNELITVFILLFLAAQLLFVFNFIFSLIWGRRVTDSNV